MNKIPQETNGRFAEQNLTSHCSSLVLSQHSSLLVYSKQCAHTHPHPFPHTRSCKRVSSPLAYDLSSTAKKDINEGTKLSFSGFFFAAELLYGTSFMVPPLWFFIMCSLFLGNPVSTALRSAAESSEQQNAGIKSDFQQSSQVKQQNFQPRAYWDDRNRPVSFVFSHLGRATGMWGLHYPYFQRHWNYEPHL